MMDLFFAEDFVRESNKIEGIVVTNALVFDEQVAAFREFVSVEKPAVLDVVRLVGVFQPNAVLRDQPGYNVRVGAHVAPEGGPQIAQKLDQLLRNAKDEIASQSFGATAYKIHIKYETLHPFTDGNGRSGRALWAWMMFRQSSDLSWDRRGFLHTWYYQSLENEQ